MGKRATIKDVAKEAGVSIALVSMVLHSKIDENGELDCNIRKETAARVFNAVKELGYIPNSAAASMRSGRTYTIAVITSDISSPFFSEICRHIENLSYDQGYSVIFVSSDENAAKLSQITDSLLKVGVDGIIVFPPPHADSVFARLDKLNVPLVLIERDITGYPSAGRVLLDNYLSVKLGIEELYNNGYRKIDFIASDMDISTIKERDDAYRKIMTNLGLKENIGVHYLPIRASLDDMTKLIRNITSRGTEAIYIPSNDTTRLAIAAIKRLGLKTPQEIAYVGFDYSLLYELADPAVSYIDESPEDLAVKSFSMLVSLIEEKPSKKKEVIRPFLVKGGSSARK